MAQCTLSQADISFVLHIVCKNEAAFDTFRQRASTGLILSQVDRDLRDRCVRYVLDCKVYHIGMYWKKRASDSSGEWSKHSIYRMRCTDKLRRFLQRENSVIDRRAFDLGLINYAVDNNLMIYSSPNAQKIRLTKRLRRLLRISTKYKELTLQNFFDHANDAGQFGWTCYSLKEFIQSEKKATKNQITISTNEDQDSFVDEDLDSFSDEDSN